MGERNNPTSNDTGEPAKDWALAKRYSLVGMAFGVQDLGQSSTGRQTPGSTTGPEHADSDTGPDDGAASVYEPVGIPVRQDPPPATVHPDTALSWLRRLAPLVLARRTLLVTSIAFALFGMAVNTAIPAVLRAGIDRAVVNGSGSVAMWAGIIAGLALLRGAAVAI